MPSTILCGALTALISLATASPVSRRITSPSVILDQATVIGTQSGAVNLFLGIPFAEPPIGDLRFRLPQAASSYNGTLNATAFGPACIQQTSTVDIPTNLSPIAAALLLAEEESSVPIPDSEDCLTINVIAPANTTADSKLPVLFWIYGGGFEDGVSSSVNGSVVVERALALGQPVVYVSVNYRLAALGFPGSKEAREARIGNLGLHDQRLGMQWVQKYISTFGGDPTKVMIWGESAGAISVALQMLNNGGNPDGLFRAAFMQSGSPPPVGPVEDGQAFFDTFATVAGCGSSLGSVAVFDCLRNVSTEVIRNATNATPSITSYQSLSLAWQPREDGVFLTADPQQLVLQGSVAPVPFVSGDCDDEGTLFALTNSNITTEQELTTYLEQFYVKSANASAAVAEVLALYPQDPTAGSPFDTGLLNVITLQYKRIAAILGDLVFQAPRRFFLSETAGKQSHWVFLNKRGKSTPIVGSAHGSDVAIIYSGGDMTDYLIRFAVNLDPNGGNTIGNEITWPAYNTTALTPELLTFLDGPALEIGTDTYRAAGMEALTRISLSNPL